MEIKFHKKAIEEIKKLSNHEREEIKKKIDSRQKRQNNILKQRGVGISYDRHGDAIHYFKAETSEDEYRVFFDIKDKAITLLGIRPRDNDTYLNLREYTVRADR